MRSFGTLRLRHARPSATRRFGRRSESVSGPRGLRLEPLERRVLLAADLTLAKEAVIDPTVVDPADRVDVGDVITYEYTVENTSDAGEVLTDVSVSDPQPGLSDISPEVVETLAPGETAVFTATYVVTQADLDAGLVSNTATATATDPDGGEVTDIATVDVELEQVAQLLVDKSLGANDDADESGDVSVGDELTFAIEVTNSGNVTLANLAVDDVIVREGDDEPVPVEPVLDDDGFNVGDFDQDDLLDVGETWQYQAVYSVADADSFDRQVFLQNVAVATATAPADDVVKAADGLVLAGGQGVGSPGYWKNHRDVWMDTNGDGVVDDQDVLVIGDWDGDGTPDGQGIVLTTTEALWLLDASQSQRGGDKRVTLGRSLVAAWLNITVAGNNYAIGDVDVGATVDEAIAWLLAFDTDGDGNPFNDPVKRKDLNAAWGQTGEALYEFLDEYNNTGLGIAIDRDTGEGVIDPAVVDEVLDSY